jgi:hypothetical protein
MLQIMPQPELPIRVPQKLQLRKQQYILPPSRHREKPLLPPSAHIQPRPSMQIRVGLLQPLKHSEPALPQLMPTHPHINCPCSTGRVCVFAYAPVLPGSPMPQQHILLEDPAAPHISITISPSAGANQQKSQTS